MNSIILCFFGLTAVVFAFPEKYTDKYDNINIDEILSNHRLLEPYAHCLLDKGRCTPEGKELKSHIKEALEENCAKCNDKQRETTRRVIKHLINHETVYWDQLKAKYDSQGKYTKKYEDDLRTL